VNEPARVRIPRPGELTAEQAGLYARITGGPRASGPQLFDLADAEGRLLGPFGPMLLAPALGEALQQLGSAVRYRTSLPGRTREMAILAVATHCGSGFERRAHEAVGRAAGLDEREIAALRTAGCLEPEDDAERAALHLVSTVLGDGDPDDAGYAETVALLGEQQITELVTLAGYYTTLAMLMRVFGVDEPVSADPSADPPPGPSTDHAPRDR